MYAKFNWKILNTNLNIIKTIIFCFLLFTHQCTTEKYTFCEFVVLLYCFSGVKCLYFSWPLDWPNLDGRISPPVTDVEYISKSKQLQCLQ